MIASLKASRPSKDTKRPITLLTAFSGLGGVETGALMSNLVCPVGSIEFDPRKPILSQEFGKIQEANYGRYGHTSHLMTVQEAAARRYDFIQRGSVYWLHGSPVCSNLSNVNTHSTGETEADVSNVKSFCTGIEAIAPEVVTVEQVPAFTQSQGAKILYKTLDDNGYLYQHRIVNMADYGVAQDRIRYWLLAWKADLKPWYFPAPTRRYGWFEACGDLPFRKLPSDRLLAGQEVAIEAHQYHFGEDSNTFLIERKAYHGGEHKIRTAFEVAPTIIRMMFTDRKPNDHNVLVNRWYFMDAMIKGEMKTLNLCHIRRICGFPDWFEYPDIPAIAGVGFGYAVSPEFVRLLALKNLN